MWAITFDEQDNQLAVVQDHPIPTPGEREALIKVHVAGICSTDLQILRGERVLSCMHETESSQRPACNAHLVRRCVSGLTTILWTRCW